MPIACEDEISLHRGPARRLDRLVRGASTATLAGAAARRARQPQPFEIESVQLQW